MTLGIQRRRTREAVQRRESTVKDKDIMEAKAVKAGKASQMPRVVSQRMRLIPKEISPKMRPKGSVMGILRWAPRPTGLCGEASTSSSLVRTRER